MIASKAAVTDAIAFATDWLESLPHHMRSDAAKGMCSAAAAVLESEDGYIAAQSVLVQIAENLSEGRDGSINL